MKHLKMAAVAVVASLSIALVGCAGVQTSVGVGATDGDDGVTVDLHYEYAATRQDGWLEGLREQATTKAKSYCERFGKSHSFVDSSVVREARPYNYFTGAPGQPGKIRIIYVCEGTDKVEVVE